MTQEKREVGDCFIIQKKCPVCDSLERRIISSIGRNLQSLQTVMCTGCGLVHSNPIPSKNDLDAFYLKK
jgi:uncharacterized Zn finger protein